MKLSKFFGLPILWCLLTSCCQEATTEKRPSSRAENETMFDLHEWRSEVLDLDSLSFNLDIEQGQNIFDFEENPNLVITHPRITLSQTTTISDFSGLFPESCKLNRPAGYAWRGVVKVFAHDDEGCLDFWLAEFRHERLSKLTLYEFRKRPSLPNE